MMTAKWLVLSYRYPIVLLSGTVLGTVLFLTTKSLKTTTGMQKIPTQPVLLMILPQTMPYPFALVPTQ